MVAVPVFEGSPVIHTHTHTHTHMKWTGFLVPVLYILYIMKKYIKKRDKLGYKYSIHCELRR